MMPREAITVPPGTPGAPMAKIPRSTQKSTIVPRDGTEPYRILEMVMQKKTSVRTEPQRWMLANSGMPNCTISLRSGSDLFAHCRATAKVAAEDMVPIAVRYADRSFHNSHGVFFLRRCLPAHTKAPSRCNVR